MAEQLEFFPGARARAGEYVRPTSAATVAAVSAAVRNVLTGITMSDGAETGGVASLPPTAAAQNTREQAGTGGRTAATLTVLNQKVRILSTHFLYEEAVMVQRIAMAPQGPEFSRFVMGYWRLMDWKMSPGELVSFIEQHLDLGVTTVDHADIYGDYQCEAAFGEALKLAPHLRNRMEIVSKCGIATRARAENTIGHYITDRDHIVLSAEQSLRNLATDHLDLLLIHRPDPLMNADEVAEAFLALHHSGKVRHFGVSNFTPAQFTLLQSRLPFTLATNQVEISPVHQPLLLDGTLDQLQQLRIRPMAWSCLGGGRLFNEEGFQPLRDELAQVAHELNADSIEQVVYAWILRLPSQPLPIIGSGKIERVRSAIVAEKLSMTRQQWFRIRKAALGYDVP